MSSMLAGPASELLGVGSLKIDSSVRWGYEASSGNYPGSGFQLKATCEACINIDP